MAGITEKQAETISDMIGFFVGDLENLTNDLHNRICEATGLSDDSPMMKTLWDLFSSAEIAFASEVDGQASDFVEGGYFSPEEVESRNQARYEEIERMDAETMSEKEN